MSAEPNSWPPIGELFVQRGYVTAQQLEAALGEQGRTGERVGEILAKRGWISRVDVAGALSTQWSWTREIDDLRRQVAEQATRIRAAGSALLA